MEMYVYIPGVEITRVEAESGFEEEREREGERSPLSRVCRGLRAVSGREEQEEGAPGEGRRASRRRLPHPAKRLLPLNRRNVIYLTQPWRRRRRGRASLPRHALLLGALVFGASLPTASVSAKVNPPPRLLHPGKPGFPSFLPSFCVYIYICA